MKFAPNKTAPALCMGGVLFLLHLAENLLGFDHETGLAVPTVLRYALIGATVLFVLLTILLCRSFPADRPLFSEHFAVPEKAKAALVLGSFLFMGGGALLGAVTVLTHGGVAPLVTAALAVVSGLCLLVLTKRMRAGEADSVTPLLPVMFFSAFWVLSLYLPAGSDPILARYWLPILAAAAVAYAFSLLAGFFRQETKARTFNMVGRAAMMLCFAAAADLDFTSALLFLGCAVILGALLSLQKAE